MRIIIFIIQKEFLQIFRNRFMLPIIFVVPFVQLLILVFAATYEMKSIKMCVVDNDYSATSRLLISKFEASAFYIVNNRINNYKSAEEYLKKNDDNVILNIPQGFERNLVKEGKAKVFIAVDAVNAMTASLIYAYTNSIIFDFNKNIIKSLGSSSLFSINITYNHWYNPELNYKTFMVPGILVLLITIISLLLSGMNIVKEKEIGTIEQINVTPIIKYQFIIGKLFPFLILALFELAFGLTLGKLIFHIPMLGSLWLLFFAAAIYIILILSIGLFISTITNTQQQAMFVSFFFMIIFIMMGGLFTAIENMPAWAQFIDKFNPVAYFIRIIRMILLKGSGFKDIKTELYSLVIFAIAMLTLSVWRYRKKN